ncbi:MAG: hypothetical protein AAB635_00425 [Patescibacteria group bacterium]
MSILDSPKKINILGLLAICFVLGLGLAFGGFKFLALTDDRAPIKVVRTNIIEQGIVGQGIEGQSVKTIAPSIYDGRVVGSVNGKKYHLLNCPGAKTIIEKNKVFFDTIALAELAGYSPAGNCKGLLK